MGIPNPLNIADDLKSDCTTYSSNKIENLITSATELPIPAAGDAGKVLTVNGDSDGYELDAIPSELPTIGEGDNGKVLGVDNSDYALIPQVNPTDIIDDTVSATTTVYSSDKVDNLLSDKQDALGLEVIDTGSLDDAAEGFAWVSCADVTDAPVSTGTGFLETFAADSDNILQRFTVYGTTPEVYVRFYNNSQWDSWYKIATVIT